jgi:hypothetical protein
MPAQLVANGKGLLQINFVANNKGGGALARFGANINKKNIAAQARYCEANAINRNAVANLCPVQPAGRAGNGVLRAALFPYPPNGGDNAGKHRRRLRALARWALRRFCPAP